MSTAIIILNYNDKENTINFVHSIENYKSIDKIVVVDNLSTRDGELISLQKLNTEKVEVIEARKNGGYAYGNNYGIHYLEEKYGKDYFDVYIISNPDVYVQDEVIEKCKNKLLEDRTIGAIAPKMRFKDKEARRSAWKERTILIDIACSTRVLEFILYPLLKKGEYSKKDFEKIYLEVDCIAGSFFLITSKAMRDISYFDENTFLFFEEDILSKKLKKKGYKIVSMCNISFTHFDSQTIGRVLNLWKKQRILFSSRKYYHKEYNHASKFTLLIFDILYFFRCIELIVEVPILKIMAKLKGNKNET